MGIEKIYITLEIDRVDCGLIAEMLTQYANDNKGKAAIDRYHRKRAKALAFKFKVESVRNENGIRRTACL